MAIPARFYRALGTRLKIATRPSRHCTSYCVPCGGHASKHALTRSERTPLGIWSVRHFYCVSCGSHASKHALTRSERPPQTPLGPLDIPYSYYVQYMTLLSDCFEGGETTSLIYSSAKPRLMLSLTRDHFRTPRMLHFCTESTYLYRIRLRRPVQISHTAPGHFLACSGGDLLGLNDPLMGNCRVSSLPWSALISTPPETNVPLCIATLNPSQCTHNGETLLQRTNHTQSREIVLHASHSRPPNHASARRDSGVDSSFWGHFR